MHFVLDVIMHFVADEIWFKRSTLNRKLEVSPHLPFQYHKFILVEDKVTCVTV